jgi:hypothetical protein
MYSRPKDGWTDVGCCGMMDAPRCAVATVCCVTCTPLHMVTAQQQHPRVSSLSLTLIFVFFFSSSSFSPPQLSTSLSVFLLLLLLFQCCFVSLGCCYCFPFFFFISCFTLSLIFSCCYSCPRGLPSDSLLAFPSIKESRIWKRTSAFK